MEAAIRITENKKGKNSISALQQVKLSPTILTWANIGGQLIPNKNVEGLLNKIKSGAIESWNQVHTFYETESDKYNARKDLHALSTLEKLTKKPLNKVSATQFVSWLDSYLEIKKDITARIHLTRAKDYVNPFRKMVYESEEEMNAIVGSLKDNGFIKDQQAALSKLEIEIRNLKKELKAK